MAKLLKEMNKAELTKIRDEMQAKYEQYCDMNLKLNMMRGVPSNEQLNLSNDMLSCLADEYVTASGMDCRNYGGLDGIPELKKIFADLLDITADEVIVGGNSSLALMFDNVASNMSHGVRDGEPWQNQGKVKFLCPVPGYDRHFTICEYFHIEMIPVGMNDNGPDMDTVERLVSADPMIKGIWCVPKYSNPTGIIYSDEVVRRFANLKPAADDFRIYWDNAYAIHDLDVNRAKILNLIRLCEEAGNPNMPLVFTSFSKVSFAGAAVTCMASSKSNCEFILKRLSTQTIGPDKMNQLRHARFFKNAAGVLAHMDKHAEILRPKFKLVADTLRQELGSLGIAEWTEPAGGYFVNFDAMEGCAKNIVSLCKQAGVTLTPAGATFPYSNDPQDKNIRLAITCPPLSELSEALKVFCVAVKLASAEKYLSESV
ncbi:MAG: aminotransferase class I/II-fold pyridoxal phosphate-dependent enzyme [Oscillospiraceae bacterium]|nr:aminotransferase class I/II-fold pyridoxal phosphate-dependent enzyme [Oscillospiraceae bacterium]